MMYFGIIIIRVVSMLVDYQNLISDVVSWKNELLHHNVLLFIIQINILEDVTSRARINNEIREH